MSDILGHDCDGRPLRVGDEAVLIWVVDPENVVNELVQITGAEDWYGYKLIQHDGFFLVVGDQLRKLRKDQGKANESFTDMLHRLNTEDMTVRNKELVFRF